MRLFVAVDVPDAVRVSIDALMVKLGPACRNARWVRSEVLHVTLKFIGEVSPDKVEEIRVALAAVIFPSQIVIRFGGLGFFPDARRPQVLYAGVQAGDALGALAAGVEAGLEAFGIPRERRSFSPHLTLARFGDSGDLSDLHAAIANAGPLEFGSAVAKEFHLYLSVLKPGGAEYTLLATFSSGESKTR